MKKTSLVVILASVGCQQINPPKTQFAQDYTALQPQIKQCHAYYDSKEIEKAEQCYRDVAPFANKTVNESNDGDDKYGNQNIDANLMSADLNNLGTLIILAEMHQKSVEKAK